MNNRIVFTGPLYLPNKFENNKQYVCYEVLKTNPPVAVPTHFFKIILCELKKDDSNKVERVLASYIIPNAPIPPNTPLRILIINYYIHYTVLIIETFAVPLSKVEQASGYLFFPNLVKAKLIDPNIMPPERQLPPPRHY